MHQIHGEGPKTLSILKRSIPSCWKGSSGDLLASGCPPVFFPLFFRRLLGCRTKRSEDGGR